MTLRRSGLRVTNFLAALIVAAELLTVSGIALSVDTEARIRATVAAGETIVAAVEGYRRQHGKLPSTLEQLVPRYLSVLPEPAYGIRAWQFEIASADQVHSDTRVGIPLALRGTDERGPADPHVFLLSVRLDPANPAIRFRRSPNGCWQLPEFPKCW